MPTNPYYDSMSTEPYTDLKIRPTMMLAGTSAANVEAMIDKAALADRPGVPFAPPPGIKLIRVDLNSGLRAGPNSTKVIVEAFKPGTAPPDGYSAVGYASPDGMPVALSIMNVVMRLFTNQFEAVKIEDISVHVESVPGRQSYSIESAWLEKGEASPGETLRLRVLVRPYRGAARIEETTIKVPDQVMRGTNLRVMVSDADWMNRASRGFAGALGQGSSAGLDPLITLINRERKNDRLYVGLFVPSPTMLWDDKELPNVPLSQINAIDGRPAPGTVQILRESLASEGNVAMSGPVTGIVSLNLPVR